MSQTAEPQELPSDGAGELVIENGPQSGFRRALVGPLTFIGRAEWSDLRVDAEAVNPWHCVIVRAATGLFLRDLNSDAGTRVNGQFVSTCGLNDGDLLAVGPVQLRVRWLPENQNNAADLEARSLALEQREKAFAAEMEAGRQELLRLREEVRGERAALLDDRTCYEERVAQIQQDMARDRVVMAERQKELRSQTERFVQIRLRLRRRWEGQVVAEKSQLADAQRAFEKDRANLYQERLRFNGEVELGRRELQAAWHGIRQEQEAHDARLSAREAAVREREAAVKRREQALADAERDCVRQTQRSQREQAQRRQELDGLETRVLNYRQRLLELERGVGSSPSRTMLVHVPTAMVPYSAIDEEKSACLAALEALADDVEDQRLQLAEHCERFHIARQEWHQERELVTAELESVAARLQGREQAVLEQEQALLTLEAEIVHKGAAVYRARNQVEADRARLATQTAAWEGERDRLLARVQAYEEPFAANRQAAPDVENARLRQQVASLHRQGEYSQHQLQELREEVEHLACLLMEEPTLSMRRLGQAA